MVVFATYLPGGAGLGMLLRRTVGPEYEVIPAVGWLAAWIVAVLRLGRFKCPRCGEVFHATRRWHNPLARECLHCGLPKWADPDPADRVLGFEDLPGERVVKTGHFMYAGTVRCPIRIVVTGFLPGSGDREDPPAVADDRHGTSFRIDMTAAGSPERWSSSIQGFETIDAALAHLGSDAIWDP